MRRIPDFLCGRRVPEIENQVQPFGHGDADTGSAQKVGEIEHVRQMRDDKAVQMRVGQRLSKSGVANSQGLARSQPHGDP